MPGTNSRDGTPLSLTPFAIIAVMQVRALALLLWGQSLSPKLVIDLAVSLPALFDGRVKHCCISGASTRPGFVGPFLCYCWCQALRSLWLDGVITAEGCEACKTHEHWPKES